jgi:hypothetical protein
VVTARPHAHGYLCALLRRFHLACSPPRLGVGSFSHALVRPSRASPACCLPSNQRRASRERPSPYVPNLVTQLACGLRIVSASRNIIVAACLWHCDDFVSGRFSVAHPAQCLARLVVVLPVCPNALSTNTRTLSFSHIAAVLLLTGLLQEREYTRGSLTHSHLVHHPRRPGSCILSLPIQRHLRTATLYTALLPAALLTRAATNARSNQPARLPRRRSTRPGAQLTWMCAAAD